MEHPSSAAVATELGSLHAVMPSVRCLRSCLPGLEGEMSKSVHSHHVLPILLALAGVFSFGTPCFAQSTVAPTPTVARPAQGATEDTIRLTDAERNTILGNNTVESAATARGEQGMSLSGGRGIHGEMGVMLGSNGARGVYGIAEVPLGDNAGAVVSFESSRFGRVRR
jgi:hypothetical protein